MKVTLLYFASLREAVGRDRETLELPGGVATVGAVRAWLRERGEPWSRVLADGRNVRAAVDRRMAVADSTFADGAELAFFPQVTGG